MHLWSDLHVAALNSLHHGQWIIGTCFCEAQYALRSFRKSGFPLLFCSTTKADDLESACTSFVGATVFELAAVRTLVIRSAYLHDGTHGFPYTSVQFTCRWKLYCACDVCMFGHTSHTRADLCICDYKHKHINLLHVCACVSLCVHVWALFVT